MLAEGNRSFVPSYAASTQVYLSEPHPLAPLHHLRWKIALWKKSWAVLAALTLFALTVQGYHPFAEDGGLYVAGVRKLLDPTLYPAWTQFVTEHLRFSLFAPSVALVVRGTHIRLTLILLLLYVTSTFATLAAAWVLAGRAGATPRGQASAASLLACWLTLPIAGTSLMLMDPYVTARSISTPLILFALAWALDGMRGARRAWLFCVAALVVSAALHPLMAGYGIAAVLLLCVIASPQPAIRRYGPWLLAAAALLLAAILEHRAPAESPAYVRIVMTRYYWFPFRWHWYEQFGLIGPLAVLAALTRHRTAPAWQSLIRLGLVLGAIAIAVATAFSRVGMSTHFVAYLQPLRSFQIVYELMTVLLGAWLGERILAGRLWRWGMLLAGIGCLMFFVQRQTFPASNHFEDPWRTPSNRWEQAFLWARDHTPTNAVFALDAHYITHDGEDAQCFRPIAQRSALPDFSKDGGEASITPALTGAWSQGEQAQLALDQQTDQQREAKIVPLGASWDILNQATPTAWPCPYANDTVKVCRLPE